MQYIYTKYISRHGEDANISRNICLIGLHKYMPMAPCYYRERNICCIIWNASKTFVLLSSKYNIQSDFLPAETLQPLILPKITSFLCFLHSFTQYVVLSVVMIGFLQEHNLKYFQFLHFLSFLFAWIANFLYQIRRNIYLVIKINTRCKNSIYVVYHIYLPFWVFSSKTCICTYRNNKLTCNSSIYFC